MESIRTVKGLIKQGDWLLKLDLKDAYLSVSIHPSHRKYLCFRWQMAVSGPAFQSEQCPLDLHEAHLAKRVSLAPAGGKDDQLYTWMTCS